MKNSTKTLNSKTARKFIIAYMLAFIALFSLQLYFYMGDNYSNAAKLQAQVAIMSITAIYITALDKLTWKSILTSMIGVTVVTIGFYLTFFSVK